MDYPVKQINLATFYKIYFNYRCFLYIPAPPASSPTKIANRQTVAEDILLLQRYIHTPIYL